MWSPSFPSPSSENIFRYVQKTSSWYLSLKGLISKWPKVLPNLTLICAQQHCLLSWLCNCLHSCLQQTSAFSSATIAEMHKTTQQSLWDFSYAYDHIMICPKQNFQLSHPIWRSHPFWQEARGFNMQLAASIQHTLAYCLPKDNMKVLMASSEQL